MRIKLYTIRTYAHLDTWSHETKQSQTKPISSKKFLAAKPKTSLTPFFTKDYVNTPQSQKQTQTNPISTSHASPQPLLARSNRPLAFAYRPRYNCLMDCFNLMLYFAAQIYAPASLIDKRGKNQSPYFSASIQGVAL